MCGIVGFTGRENAAPVLLDGLSKLEYRGYDSAGIALCQNGGIRVVKATGKLHFLQEKLADLPEISGLCGIGHTRWATHGAPDETNAHPHFSGTGEEDSGVVCVHNGIIENFRELKEELAAKGYRFYSQTDTEVAVKLVDFYYRQDPADPVGAIARTVARIRGSYALELLFRDYPGEIFVARKDSPMIIGIAEGQTFVASDVPAILKYTRQVFYIGDLEIARLSPGKAAFFDSCGNAITKELTEILFSAEMAERGGYEHFMLKEIHEQPRAIRDTLHSVMTDGELDLSALGLTTQQMQAVSQICVVACGSAWHVGQVAQYVFEDLARIPVRVELASEFRYRNAPLDPNALVIVISQSGETADSLAALREAKNRGIRTLAIVNVVGSSIAREADTVFYTLAGPEIAVATTKAYSTQLVACYALALAFGKAKGTIAPETYTDLLAQLQILPDQVGRVLEERIHLQELAGQFRDARDAFFIGRGLDYAVSLEGSLKMKEISYIHSEAYAAGELKHGSISLVEPGTLVVGIMTQQALLEKTLSNLVECKSRGACLIGVMGEGSRAMADAFDACVFIPDTDPHFAPSLAVVPLQLLGYYVSLARGLDVDKPRNLAKSVTVE